LYFLAWVAISLGTYYGSGGGGNEKGLLSDAFLLLVLQFFPVAIPILMLWAQGRRILPWIAGGSMIGAASEGYFFTHEMGYPAGWLFYIVTLAGLFAGFAGTVGLIVNAMRDRAWELALACSPLLLVLPGMWWLTRMWYLAD
jgi:hypothetical protein